jgi:hypothetical protein
MSEETFRRNEEAFDRELQRREARDRRDLAEGQTELREFRGSARIAAPVNAALYDWLQAMNASAWAYAPLEQRCSEIVAADPLGTQKRRPA